MYGIFGLYLTEEEVFLFDHFYFLPINKCLLFKLPVILNKKQNNQGFPFPDGVL